MGDKILVAYASKCGSTGEVAAAIGEVLCSGGAAVDVRRVQEVADLGPYRAVVLGSCVRFGRWISEAVQFVEKNQAALRQVPTAFFTMHIMNLSDSEESRGERAAYLDAVHKLLPPKAEAFFPGASDPAKLSFFERTIGRMVKSPEGDLRDWAAIRAWAAELRPALGL